MTFWTCRRSRPGTLEFTESDVDLKKKMFFRIEQSMKLRIPDDHPVEVAFEDPGGDYLIHTDPNRLMQVVTNFMTNAIKFTSEGRHPFRLPESERRRVIFLCFGYRLRDSGRKTAGSLRTFRQTQHVCPGHWAGALHLRNDRFETGWADRRGFRRGKRFNVLVYAALAACYPIILSFHFMFSGFRLLSDRHLGRLKRVIKYRRKRSCAIIPNMAGTLIFTKSVDRYRLRGTGCTVAKNYGFLHAVDGEEADFGNWRTATTRIPSVGSEFPVYRRLLERYKETPAQSLIVRVFVILYALRCGEIGIRTLRSAFTLNGFQDRRNRPLCHLSGDKSRTENLFFQMMRSKRLIF